MENRPEVYGCVCVCMCECEQERETYAFFELHSNFIVMQINTLEYFIWISFGWNRHMHETEMKVNEDVNVFEFHSIFFY